MAEPHATLRTGVRPLTRVRAQMCAQVAHSSKAFLTLRARVRLDTGVDDHVLAQAAHLFKAVSTVGAAVRLLTRMRACVYG